MGLLRCRGRHRAGQPADRRHARRPSRNLKEAYRFLAESYAEGDEIWCFGFSRGAYTARSLCGFLGVAGLLRHRDLGLLDDAFEYYRLPKAKRVRQPLRPDQGRPPSAHEGEGA
ncbi:MAG: DUF2235 domain-containing protein [Geminicoccaceae bacterium]